jgi:acyl dehydratase/NAD(P)-dependent dehydrogenase (short-subunit alcohol dehydrogenase family)
MSAHVASRVFDAADQDLFARLSGDANPMHMDPVAARRTQAGAPVVHGIRSLLWSLDTLIAGGHIAQPIASLDVQFQKFIYVGSEATLRIVRETATGLQAELAGGGLRTTVIKIGFAPAASQETASLCTQAIPPLSAPIELDVADLPRRSGFLPGSVEKPIARLFPHAAEHLGAPCVEAIARLSTLVGMVCPGLHSIFSGLSIGITRTPSEEANGLSFQVTNVDERFRMAEIAVRGGGIFGTVTAFVRQPPIAQPSVRELARMVSEQEFSGVTALIVGGSRGLGALTAKAIVAGGGRVVITYVAGEIEAREIAREIGPDACRVMRYDAREDAAPQLACLEWDTNQLYYFATTHIFRQKAEWYVPARFAEFCRIYVEGFEAICTALQARGAKELSAFYPSSIALENRPRDMTEYCMAKAAGEVLCADMNRFARGMRVVVKRLPRLLTDQTATVMPTESEDPAAAMLPIIREMRTGARALVEA